MTDKPVTKAATRPFRIAGRARDEQPTYINLQDRARFKRVMAGMLYAGGMPIHNVKLDNLDFEEILKALEQLTQRLEGAANHYQEMQAELTKYRQILVAFKALGRMLKEDDDGQ